MQKLFNTLLFLLVMKAAWAQHEQLYEKKEFIKSGDTLRYRIMYPVNYSASKKYPLIVLMHGSGEKCAESSKGQGKTYRISWCRT